MYRECSPGVYYIEAGKGISRANVYFIKTESAWVLIDAGLVDCGQLIHQTAESIFGVGTRPASILLTHNHPDHAGAALELARLWDCPVYVHPDELPYISISDLPSIETYANPLDRWIILPIFRMMPKERVETMLTSESVKNVARAFDPNMSIPDLPDWRCIPTPGHTPGHSAFFRASDRVLITGDAIVTVELNSIWRFLLWSMQKTRQKISGPPWYSTWNWQTAKESVKVLVELEPRVVASGHGEPMSGNEIARELRIFADHFNRPTPSRKDSLS